MRTSALVAVLALLGAGCSGTADAPIDDGAKAAGPGPFAGGDESSFAGGGESNGAAGGEQDAPRRAPPRGGAPPVDAGAIDASPPCVATDLAGKLACIPGVKGVTEVTTPAPPDGYRRFDFTLAQPVDHAHPAASFEQRLSLLHVDEAAPMVLATSGYGLSTGRSEITRTLVTNQISVEHRYFAPSIPAAPIDWSKLDIAQSAADFHRVTVALKGLYRGKWLNTGTSKGGMTSVYHRRFYPSDLDATVAYVAPMVYGTDDARFPTFVAQAGGPTYAQCRQKLAGLQQAVLARRAEMTPRMTGTYDALGGKDVAIEHAVLELPFGFWQYQSPTQCASIPAPDAPAQTLFQFFAQVAQISNYGDQGFEYFSPYYYQAATQLGAPGVDDVALLPLLQHRATYSPASYAPKNVPLAFDPQPMLDVQAWVRASGRTMLFVYGEYDPWTAGTFELGTATDSFVYVAPGKNHGAKIDTLSATDRQAAWSTIARWLGVPPPAQLRAAPPAPHVDMEDEALRPRRRL